MNTLASDRLRRLLFLVPWVSRHPGRPVDEVAQAVGCTRAELLEELDLITLVGHPPFQPDDFVDVYVEDDRVFVTFDQRLSAPPALTAAEGVALASAAAILKPSGPLLTALGKLEGVLPMEANERYREQIRRLDVGMADTDTLTTLTAVIVEQVEIEFDYLGVGRGEREARRVRPLELKSRGGEWYLRAHCLARADERLFRVDRISRLVRTAVRFGEAAAPAPSTPSTRQVTVRFSPALAPYQQERFANAGRLEADGALVVTVPGDSEGWLARWVLSFGGEARVVSPEWAIRVVADAAKASLQSL